MGFSEVKRGFFPLALLAAVLFTACSLPDDFVNGGGFLPSGDPLDNGGGADDGSLASGALPLETTVWLDTVDGTQDLEFENLQTALDWLKTNAVDGGNYTVSLSANQTIAPQSLNYGAPNKIVSVTLVSIEENEKQIGLTKTGSLFTIGANVTLTLERGVTLKGRSDNKNPLVTVEKNGTFVMKDGSVIRDNVNTDGYYHDGAGVFVVGKFTMDGGSIINNKMSGSITHGGGVLLTGAAEFTMNGGLISGNYAYSNGGGVAFDHSLTSNERAIFLMTGGTISNNETGWGGGVYVSGYTDFTMTGGVISNNKASAGGGVCVSGHSWGQSGEFTMTGGVIRNNIANSNGGGIFSQYAHKGKVVIGGNAVISDNEADLTNPNRGNSLGGGIYTSSIVLKENCVIEGNKARAGAGVYLTYHESLKTVSFTMTGGVIRSNTAVEFGGGVAFCYLSQGQPRSCAVPFAFDKTGGTIYGYDGGANANIVLNAVDKDGGNNGPGGWWWWNGWWWWFIPYNDNNNNNSGVIPDRGRAVFVFDEYWGQSYDGSDDSFNVYAHKEITSPPADRLGARDNVQPSGAWD